MLIGQTMIVAHARPVSDFYFPFVWAGYVLVVDAAALKRRGWSLLLNRRALFFALFPVSSLFWWIFELFNQAVHNWVYVGGEMYTGLGFVGLASLDFSFVLPAVVESAILIGSFLRPPRPRPARDVPPAVLAASIAAGLLSLALPVLYPRYFFGLIWGCLYFLLDPLNYRARLPSLWRAVWSGDWRTPLSFALGALLCGFFWEFWNYWAMPKWIYTIPYVNFWHVFEMPLLGWIGYLPFGLELFAMANFVFPRLGVGTITVDMDHDRPTTTSRAPSQAAQ